MTQLVASNLILVASPKSGITSMQQLIAQAKANPGKLNYGSSGVGNPLHLTMEMIKHATGIDILAVPFRGDAQINAALIAGDVEVAVVPLATAVPLIQDGRIRGLGDHRRQALADRARHPDRRRKRRPGLCLQQLAGLVHGGEDACPDRRAHPAGNRQGAGAARRARAARRDGL